MSKALTLYSSHSRWRLSSTAAPSPVSSSGAGTLQHSANTHTHRHRNVILASVHQCRSHNQVCVCVCVFASYQRSLMCVWMFEVNDLQGQGLLRFGHVSFPSSLEQRVALKLIWTHTHKHTETKMSTCQERRKQPKLYLDRVESIPTHRGASDASAEWKTTKTGVTSFSGIQPIYSFTLSDPAAY